jgi:hypothetical protein
MEQLSRCRVRRTTPLAVLVAAFALGCGPDEMEPRTPIDVSSLGPQVGEPVPDFALVDQLGQPQTLESILGPDGGLLLFHRSADW